MKPIHLIQSLLSVIIFVFVISSCANRGQGPQGGPKDTIPPSVLKSYPANKAINITKPKIEIVFDENIVIQKVAEKVIISPPQRIAPNIQAYGKTLHVEFNDTLQPNTTYSINFGDAIADNNENNSLKNYVFAFATGSTIDTLEISGTIINAENLNPMQGITVGIYSDMSDSAFLKIPFQRITKSDENGLFTVPNIKEGKYKVRALKDDNRDNMLQPGEGIAFLDSIFSPSVEIVEKTDTILKDSATIDTVKVIKVARFYPNNILLKYFKDNSKRQRFVKYERKSENFFTLFFNAPSTELPILEPLNFEWKDKYRINKNATLDTLTYWITDYNVFSKDTLSLKMTYLKTDSTNKLIYSTDTLNIAFRKKPNPSKGKDNMPEYLNIRSNITGKFDIYNPILLSFDVPVQNFDSTKIHLNQMRDTVSIPLLYNISRKDSIGLQYAISYKWQPETAYQLQIDSAAFYSIYNLNTNSLKSNFTVKSLDEYSGLKLMLEKFDPTVVFQILNAKDEVVRTAPAMAKGILVSYLEPGDYYIRLFIDKNNNGKWDAGNYMQHLQPEDVYYYTKKLTLIKNWELEETIDYEKIPLLEQKPKELIKKEQKDRK